MRLNAGGLGSLVIGRQQEITTLKNIHKTRTAQSSLPTAPRRYGKTTLAMRVLEELKADYLIVRVDTGEATDINELCDIYLNAVYKSVGIADFCALPPNRCFRYSIGFRSHTKTKG